jgi:uncharacterized protein
VNLGKRLFDLQQIDLDLDKTTQTLLEIERQLSINQDLEDAKALLQNSQQRLSEMQSKQKSAEWSVDDLQAKLKPIQQKLFAGTIHNPKDLVNLQQQASQLKNQLREEEDKALDIMDQVEVLQSQIAGDSAQVKRLEEEWEVTRKQLLAEQARLNEVLESTQQKRNELASTLDADHLAIYENLRERKQGQAVARIEQGRCQGCRLSVPVSELTQARAGELVQCGSCGRVLCLG